MSKAYKHLFFDLDHTLWDFDRNSELTLRKLYNEYQLADRGITDFDAFFRSYCIHNDKLWERFRNGYIRRDELRWKRIWLALIDFKIGDTALAHELSTAYLEILPTQTLLTPYAKDLLEHCKGRYVMHLITNGFEKTQWRKLDNSKLGQYFEEVITSETSNSVKPNKEIFDYALRITGAELQQSIMIGDNLDADIQGAINAGMDSIFVNHINADLKGIKPTYVITHLKELEEIF